MSSQNENDNALLNNDDQPISTVTPKRRVHFPSDESQLRMISIAPEPLSNHPLLSLGVILQRYRGACQRLQIRPLNTLLEQLSTMDDDRKSFHDRLDSLKIVNEKLDLKHIDAIEEILSRCRFHTLDLESSCSDDLIFIQLFDVIEYYESCTHLNLSNNRSIGIQGYQALTRYVRKTRYLERLDMNSIRFDDTSMLGFGRALRMSSTIHELHMESCQLNGKILQKFVQNLRSCPCLRELYLCDNRLQVQDSLLINELIRSCGQFLQILDLRSNSLQDNGMSHIASQLSQYDQHHTQQNSIYKISFQSNQLTQQGVAFLAKSLLHNRTIRSLNLSHNNINNEGLFLLRDALLTNRTINELILRDCRLTDQAAIALAEFIAESSTIQYIDLRENNIQASGICGMAIAIKNNKSLLKLDFDPIVPTATNKNSQSNNNNIDRTISNASSLLSLSSLRRMTVSLGGFTSSTPTNTNAVAATGGGGGGGTRELLEQKTKWMNDIENICQRNLLIYEEKLGQQEDEQQNEKDTINDTNQQESAVVATPDDIILEEQVTSTIETENNIPLATTDDEHSKSSIQNNSEEVPGSIDEIPQSIDAAIDDNNAVEKSLDINETEQSASTTVNENNEIKQSLDTPIKDSDETEQPINTTVDNNSAIEQPLHDSTNNDNIVEQPIVTDTNNRSEAEQTTENAVGLISSSDNQEKLETNPIEENVTLPDSPSLSNLADDDDKRKIHHSDSLYLLRKKVQNEDDDDEDNTSDDESQLSSTIDQQQMVDGV